MKNFILGFLSAIITISIMEKTLLKDEAKYLLKSTTNYNKL